MFDRFLISLVLTFLVSTFLLALLEVNAWDAYFSLYLIEYLVLTAMFVFMSPSAGSALSKIAYILTPGFGIMLVVKAGIIILAAR